MLRISVVALLLSASSVQATQICSGPGDREWTVDGTRISTKLRAETAVGILKNERDLNRGKRWLVQFPGGQAFLTIADGHYTLLNDDGTATNGTCVSR